MAYKMKGHTLPGINQRSDEKMDLTKKNGGPQQGPQQKANMDVQKAC